MDVRLTSEQRQLRDAAARLADDLGPGSVADLDDANRRERLEKAVDVAGWRSLRSDGASGVEVALVAEEFARGLIDVAFLGPVLADDLRGAAEGRWTIGVDGRAVDAAGRDRVLLLDDRQLYAAEVGARLPGADLTRTAADIGSARELLGELSPEQLVQWRALAVTTTTADLLGAARGTHRLAVDYAKVRAQYGHPIGTYQAVAHLLAESLALIEGSISVLRYAAWAVDELAPAEEIGRAHV